MGTENYESLVNNIINKSVLAPFHDEITELSQNYIGPVNMFGARNESMLENAFGGNPFKLEVRTDSSHFNISSLLLANGQAYINNVADARNTFSNFYNKSDCSTVITKKDKTVPTTDIEDIINTRNHVSTRIRDDDVAYMNITNKYGNMQNTMYLGQGKHIKVQEADMTVHSGRQNASTVIINSTIKKPTLKACLVEYEGNGNDGQKYSMLFLDVIQISTNVPKTIVNYLSSQQMFYKITDYIREQLIDKAEQLSDGQMFTVDLGINFNDMLLKKVINKFFDKGAATTYESPKIDGIDIVVEKLNVSDMTDAYYGKIPELFIIEGHGSARGRVVMSGMELCNSPYKSVLFDFLIDLERQGSVIYDSPSVPTRLFIDSVMNAVYRYYDNLRFTPLIESIYTRVFPSLYFVWSKLFSMGENYLECDYMFDQIIDKIIKSAQSDEKVKDISILKRYFEHVYGVLSCMKQLYAFPTHRKYSTNRMLAFMSCGNFYTNLRNISIIVARTGFDVSFDRSKSDLLDINIDSVSVRGDIGSGAINYAVGSVNLSAFLKKSTEDINKIMTDLNTCSQIESAGYYWGKSDKIESDTGRTYKINPVKATTAHDLRLLSEDNGKYLMTAYASRIGNHLFELETDLSSDRNLSNGSKFYTVNSILEGFLFSICHNPGYSLLLAREQFSSIGGKQFTSDNMPVTLRKILWWVQCLNLNVVKEPLGVGLISPSEACLNDRIVYSRIADKLFSQSVALLYFDVADGNFKYYSGNSSYVTGREPGYIYKFTNNLTKPDGSNCTESTLLAGTLLTLLKDARQSQHVISLMYNNIYNLLNELQLAYNDRQLTGRIYQKVISQFPELDEAIPIEVVREYVDCIYTGRSVFESEIIQNSAAEILKINLEYIKTYIIKTNKSFNGNDYSLSVPLSENTLSYIGGRLGFVKESCIFREGGTNKIKYQNNAVSLYPNIDKEFVNLDIKCVSPWTLRHGTLTPIAKKL